MGRMESGATMGFGHKQRDGGKISVGKQQALWQSGDTVVLIDLCTRIADCSPAATQLLCRPSDELSGLPLSEIISDLPFASETPVYNLAFAVFHAADGMALQSTARTADGKTIPVNISLSSQVMNGKRHISLALMPSTNSIYPTRLGEQHEHPNQPPAPFRAQARRFTDRAL